MVMRNRKASAAKLADDVLHATGITVCAQTIHNALNDADLHGRRPRRKPLLKKRHKTARLNFAKEHEMKSEEYWKTILWSDETKINLFGSDGVQHVWRGLGEEYCEDCMVPTVKHGGGHVMVWGCTSAKGVSTNFH